MVDKMKILAVHETPYRLGTWERFDLMISHLRELGHAVIILSLGPATKGQHNIVAIDIARRPVLRALNELAYRFSLRSVDRIGYLVAAARTLSAQSPDLVLFRYASTGLPLFLMTRLLRKRPLLIYDWNDLISRMESWPLHEGIRYRLRRRVEENLMAKLSDGIVVVTQFARALLMSWGIPKDKIFVLNEIVSVEPYAATRLSENLGKRNRGPVTTIVWHGHVRRYQIPGLRAMLEALRVLRVRGLPCQLKIIGPWEDYAQMEDLKSQAKALCVDAIFVGFLGKAELRRHLVGADLGLHLLPNDLFARFISGVKLSEYISAGLPVICSDLEGPSELVRGNGFLVSYDDPACIADRIELAIKVLRDELARKSIEIAEAEFSQRAIRQKIVSLSKFLEARLGVASA